MIKPVPIIILNETNSDKTLENQLGIKGFALLPVKTGQQALETLVQQEVPVVILDLKQENISGLETLRRIRESSPLTECILLTDQTSKDTAIEAINLGVFSYIQKPYDPEYLFLTIRNAIEKQKTQKALRQSESMYRRLHESMVDAFVLVDMEGHLRDWNPAYRDLLGYSDEELPHLNYEDLTPPKWHAFEAEIVQGQILPKGYSDVYEKEYCRKDGKVFPVELRTFLLKNEEGRPVGLWAIVRDITERKRLEESLARSRREWEDIFQAIGHLTLILGPDQSIQKINRVGEMIIEQKAEALIGKKCFEIFHQASAPPQGCPFNKMKASKEVEASEMVIEALNRFFLVSCTPVLDRNGNLEKVIHLATDITDRKKAEEALKYAEQRYRTLFEEAPAMYVITKNQDGSPIISDCNELFLKTLGYPRKEVIQRPLADFYTPESRYKLLEGGGYQRALTSQCLDEERELVTVKGQIIQTLLQALPETDHEGQVMGTRAMFLDITQKKKTEAESKKLGEQFRQAQKLEAVGRLAGGVAHDFNNLLSVILGYGEIVLDTLHKEHPSYEPLKAIYEAGQKARDLTRQLLAFSRKQVLEVQKVDINTIVSGFERLLRRVIGEDVELKLILSDQFLPIKADSSQIEQVLMNLAVNARDAMPNGGLLTIETDRIWLDDVLARQRVVKTPGFYALIKVSDTGCGMEQNTLERLFEPFFTTKEMGKGTGLGLATSYGIIKQHGGSIWAYSEPGQGTTFTIYLPVSSETDDPTGNFPEEVTDLQGSETILLVEDDAALRELTTVILKRLGYDVLRAENGRAALSLLDHYDHPIHLLLTDVIMPGMSGHNLSSIINNRFPQIKVLFMSGYGGEIIARHGVMDEGLNFIQKPFTVQALASKVRKVLEGVKPFHPPEDE